MLGVDEAGASRAALSSLPRDGSMRHVRHHHASCTLPRYYPGIRQPQDTYLHPHLSTGRQLIIFIRLTTEQIPRSSHFYGCPKSHRLGSHHDKVCEPICDMLVSLWLASPKPALHPRCQVVISRHMSALTEKACCPLGPRQAPCRFGCCSANTNSTRRGVARAENCTS